MAAMFESWMGRNQIEWLWKESARDISRDHCYAISLELPFLEPKKQIRK